MIDNLLEKRNKISELNNNIEKLNTELTSKINELETLKRELYNDYYSIKREEYSLLKDLPIKPNSRERHFLYDYSILNIDEVGKIICNLFDIYENKDMICYRGNNYGYIRSENVFHHELIPTLMIKNKNKKDSDNIVIEYNKNLLLCDYPTNNPVYWNKNFVSSNYNYLIGEFANVLSFDNKNYEFITELIYSLAYYQKQHDIKYMSEEETRKVYKRIYKK